ncbi:stage II sporulation protein E [Desulfonispora thiosulfatigenes DSM 11270]|uniref:Stage II sporulation protein E n=1 Tax=Desulfonispora thiosulfatigenes DSM 11270 TaxID=656914 RepID=A0A1W1UYQ5_DESTI|nr:stage II sporulation protein E [Desulfonispora thiosulfatigenes]SMB86237.1 stage II sporulation protein E [Desulfonispora thiosulfatigenes DSM 11270]
MIGKAVIRTNSSKSGVMLLNWLRLDNFIFCIVGFILTQAVILGEIKPFASAYIGSVAVWDKQKRWWVLGGTLLGTLFTNNLGHAIPSLIISILIFSILYNQFLVDKKQWIIVPSIIASIILVVNGILIVINQGTLYNWVSIVFESAFAGLITLVMITTFGAVEKYKHKMEISLEEKVSLVIVILGVLLGLGNVNIASVNVQSLISKIFVLSSAYLAGPGGGAAIGTIVGLVPSVTGNISVATIGFYSLSGLLGGVFRGLGKVGIIIGFTLGNLILSMYFSGTEQVINTLIETLIAGVIFAIIPLKALMPEVEKKKEEMPAFKDDSSEKLERMSKVFNELSKAFNVKEEIIEKDQENPVIDILKEVSGKVCDRCTHYQTCWKKDYLETYQSMVEACNKGESKGRIDEKHFSLELQRRCMRIRELSLALWYQLELYKKDNAINEKILSSQQVVATQLEGVAGLVKGFAQEVTSRETTNEELAEAIKFSLMEENIKIQNVKVIETDNDDKEIIIVQESCPGQSWCTNFIAPKVSQFLDRTYTVKQSRCPTAGNSSCTYHLNPTKAYSVTTGVAMAIKDGGDISGDDWSCLSLPNRKYAMILGDGMGAGAKAFKESHTAINLLERLLTAGLTQKMAVETVNSVLYLRSNEETFTTIDMVVVNEVSAIAEFIKVCSPPSFIKRNNTVNVVKSKSLPAGILNQVEVEHFKYAVNVDDIIINMTDGVFDAINGSVEDWCKVIENLPHEDPQLIADYIIELAKYTLNGNINDDLTVLVARIDYRSE